MPDATPGLVALDLDVAQLSGRQSLDDVRVVDAAGRQIPYVVDERRTLHLIFPLVRAPRYEGERVTRYLMDLPTGGTLRGILHLTTPDRLFERQVSIAAKRSTDSRNVVPLGQYSWSSRSASQPAPALEAQIPPMKAAALELTIEDGDNPPLTVREATLDARGSSLRFVHPGHGVRLAYGNDHVSAPQYDLALRAHEILAAPARHLVVGAEIERGSSLRDQHGVVLTIAIAAVTVLLLLLIARLLRSERTS